MRITDIKNYPVWVGHRNQMLVKVETDEGIYGWGRVWFFRSRTLCERDGRPLPRMAHRSRPDAARPDMAGDVSGTVFRRRP